ncbi:sensor histidine kinase [Streptomyces sp. SJL17-1]|uniref:sensor histidine kinase n=1 Tax=Streptomyces sp. SJL17-1 TaxID=2967223 RepID=UPI002967379B|nr:histidine kinase [Streptomyces sp. SJL17-1]
MAIGALAVAGLLVLRGRASPYGLRPHAADARHRRCSGCPPCARCTPSRRVERRRGEVVAASAAVAVVAFVPWRDLDRYAWSLPETLGVLLAGLLAVAPAALGLLGRARAELAARLAELALSRERERSYAAEQAALQERERLARDVHDTAAHHLSLISLRCSRLAATADSAPYREEAAALGELSRRAAADLRRAIRPTVRASRGSRSFSEAARDLVEAVHLEPGDCPPAVEHAAYRIVQEGLTNIPRHAPGAAARVTVRRAGPSCSSPCTTTRRRAPVAP